MALIRNIEEVKSQIGVAQGFDYTRLFPYFDAAESNLIKMLGLEQFEELKAYYEDGLGGIPAYDALIPKVQKPLVFFAFLQGFDTFNVSIGNNGFAVIEANSLVPASKTRTSDLQKNLTDNAYIALELLLVFLERYKSDYPLWESSDAYALQYKYLIFSAIEFDKLYPINESRLTFLNWRHEMADVEKLQIEPIISTELLNELKTQIKQNSVSEKNAIILPMLKKGLAYITAGNMEEKPAYSKKGEWYINQVQTLINATPDDYPTFKTSPIYVEDKVAQDYENDDENLLPVFG